MRAMLHAPWSDEITLLGFSFDKDADGFETVTPAEHVVYCNWQDGVSQSEFYLANKNGMRAAAQVEIYKVDMLEAWPRGTTGKRFVEFNGERYEVLRDFPQSFDTQTLILSEVVR